MQFHPDDHWQLEERLGSFWHRGMRLARRLAIAFGLSAATAIAVGAAVTDNAFAQIVVTVIATIAFWLPFLFVVSGIERFFVRRRPAPKTVLATANHAPADDSWRRLAVLAPGQSERLGVLRRSLDRSRLELGKADLDPDAHDLCVLIDRRLPELIDRELDSLPPDDRDRGRQIGELVELIEQFARHCGRRGHGDAGDSGYDAAVLRRRFEDRLSGNWTD
ncbi:MAG TPA: hypothetical protein VEB39_03850 [Sphingomicrobium sp.]|nr:hypothetical protein [Sphingomicrobium sp.]